MENNLSGLLERLKKDIDSMPWDDKKITHQQLRESVYYFVRAFANDAQEILNKNEENKNAETKEG